MFVEVGAQDGLWLSNTWWLEAVMGWRGLLIEADPHNYLKLKNSPRTAVTFQGCVTPSLLTTQVCKREEWEEGSDLWRNMNKLDRM